MEKEGLWPEDGAGIEKSDGAGASGADGSGLLLDVRAVHLLLAARGVHRFYGFELGGGDLTPDARLRRVMTMVEDGILVPEESAAGSPGLSEEPAGGGSGDRSESAGRLRISGLARSFVDAAAAGIVYIVQSPKGILCLYPDGSGSSGTLSWIAVSQYPYRDRTLRIRRMDTEALTEEFLSESGLHIHPEQMNEAEIRDAQRLLPEMLERTGAYDEDFGLPAITVRRAAYQESGTQDGSKDQEQVIARIYEDGLYGILAVTGEAPELLTAERLKQMTKRLG